MALTRGSWNEQPDWSIKVEIAYVNRSSTLHKFYKFCIHLRRIDANDLFHY